ncbi:hypothetical protein [Agromyces sp. Marseille-P2726]|uniref:hypothetical protein n=1 Tax=Agromyces sp. Marseille-P2726 TaxID=2709132 RepID=UPI00156FE637|nr:hypothetical protein [Agromyces sp. Marseille-P2726]
MSSARTLIASGLIMAAGTLLATAVAGPASARPEAPPEPIRVSVHYGECPLTRIDTQYVRCDDLTGAGVPAPSWIPEQ